MERILTEQKMKKEYPWYVSDQLLEYQELSDAIREGRESIFEQIRGQMKQMEEDDDYEEIREEEQERDWQNEQLRKLEEEDEMLAYYDDLIHGTEDVL